MVDVGALGGEAFGMDHIAAAMEAMKPDIFLVYNDIIVTCRLYNALLDYRHKYKSQTRFVSYLDLVYPFEKATLVRHVDRNTDQIFVFSPCWKRNLVAMGVAASKVFVFPHGVPESPPTTTLTQTEARTRLGLPQDAFVLLNANRNTYRKAQDILMAAFVRFLIQENWDPRIRLFVHCEPATRSGYTLDDLVDIEALRHGVNPAKIHEHLLHIVGNREVSDDVMTTLYVATDVGINTCMGEGFGLCNAEHAALGRPQIVSAVGALPDIFAEGGALLVPPRVWIRVPSALDEHSGDLGVCDAEDFAAAMSVYFHNLDRRRQDGDCARERIPRTYCWNHLLATFFENLVHP
jgi:glycosyltransferase involved in cell wall biosynthesis